MSTRRLVPLVGLLFAVSGCAPAFACPTTIEEVPLASPAIGYHLCAALDGGESIWTAYGVPITYGHTITEAQVIVADSIAAYCPQHTDLVVTA